MNNECSIAAASSAGLQKSFAHIFGFVNECSWLSTSCSSLHLSLGPSNFHVNPRCWLPACYLPPAQNSFSICLPPISPISSISSHFSHFPFSLPLALSALLAPLVVTHMNEHHPFLKHSEKRAFRQSIRASLELAPCLEQITNSQLVCLFAVFGNSPNAQKYPSATKAEYQFTVWHQYPSSSASPSSRPNRSDPPFLSLSSLSLSCQELWAWAQSF